MERNYKYCFKKTKKKKFKTETISILNFRKKKKRIEHFLKNNFNNNNSKIFVKKEEKNKNYKKNNYLKKLFKAKVNSIVFLSKIKLSITEKRKSKIEEYQKNYIILQKKLLTYFTKKLKPILKKIWDNSKNLSFVKNKRKLEKLCYYYKLDFKNSIENSSIDNVKKIIDNIINLLNFEKKFWKEIKELSNKIFKGEQKVFPDNFFYDLELKNLKISFHGFYNLKNNEKCSFIFFIFIFVKIILSIISKPSKYLHVEKKKTTELIFINTLFICSILENLILISLKKNFKFNNDIVNDIEKSFVPVERPKIYIISNKLIRLSSLGNKNTIFFEDSISINYLNEFFVSKEINFTYIKIEKFILQIRKLFEK